MKKDDFYEEDDGRTIADMSGIERQPTVLPHFHRKRSDFSAPDAPRANDRPWESAAGELTREERNAAIRGALKAGTADRRCVYPRRRGADRRDAAALVLNMEKGRLFRVFLFYFSARPTTNSSLFFGFQIVFIFIL